MNGNSDEDEGGGAGSVASGASRGSRRSRRSPPAATPTLAATGTGEEEERRPRGNIPKIPDFDGDKSKDRYCYRKYVRRVENFVAIASKIISLEEISVRLYNELTGKAFDYMEGTTPDQFDRKDGYKILLKVLAHSMTSRS